MRASPAAQAPAGRTRPPPAAPPLPHAAGGLVGRGRRRRPSRRCQSSSSAVDSSGRRAGLVLDIRQRGRRQARARRAGRPPRRQLDRPAQLVALHRPDEDMVACEQSRQRRVGGAAPVEVGPEREHHEPSPSRSCASRTSASTERRPLSLVAAGGEELLELVDHQHTRAGAGTARAQLAHRMLAGTDHRLRPLIAARQHPAGQRGQQARLDNRRFAAPRRPDHAEQRRADGARNELGNEPLATAEVLARRRPSKEASPLNGHTTGVACSASESTRPPAACRSITPAASPASAMRSSLRPAAARGRTPTTRLLASSAPTRARRRGRGRGRRGSPHAVPRRAHRQRHPP